MKNNLVDEKILELLKVLNAPSDGICKNFQDAGSGAKDGACESLRQDALDWVRLRVKYILFDLEATRRENAYLKRLIEAE